MNKIAVISDVHGNCLALEAVLEDIEKNKIKTILNLGDSLYGPLDPNGTYQLLSKRNFITISGNQDRFIVENWNGTGNENPTLNFVLNSLPSSAFDWLKNLGNHKNWNNVFLCHGNLQKDDVPLIEKFKDGKVIQKSSGELEHEVQSVEQKIILCGHTHLPKIIKLSDSGKFIVNPGSVGLPAYDDYQPFYHEMESGSPLAKYVIIEFEGSQVVAICQRHVTYDHYKAAKQAEKNGRPDWVYWIKTGNTKQNL